MQEGQKRSTDADARPENAPSNTERMSPTHPVDEGVTGLNADHGPPPAMLGTMRFPPSHLPGASLAGAYAAPNNGGGMAPGYAGYPTIPGGGALGGFMNGAPGLPPMGYLGPGLLGELGAPLPPPTFLQQQQQVEPQPYRDFSRIPLTDVVSEEDDTTLGRKDKAKEPSFSVKLHQILSNPEFQECIVWLPHGRCWRVLKPKAFEEKVIPKYFRHAKYASFMRQVNGWGFKRITQGPDHNSYYHEMFLRGLPELAMKMRRPSRSTLAAAGDCGDDIDFYKLSMLSPLPGQGARASPPELGSSKASRRSSKSEEGAKAEAGGKGDEDGRSEEHNTRSYETPAVGALEPNSLPPASMLQERLLQDHLLKGPGGMIPRNLNGIPPGIGDPKHDWSSLQQPGYPGADSGLPMPDGYTNRMMGHVPGAQARYEQLLNDQRKLLESAGGSRPRRMPEMGPPNGGLNNPAISLQNQQDLQNQAHFSHTHAQEHRIDSKGMGREGMK